MIPFGMSYMSEPNAFHFYMSNILVSHVTFMMVIIICMSGLFLSMKGGEILFCSTLGSPVCTACSDIN